MTCFPSRTGHIHLGKIVETIATGSDVIVSYKSIRIAEFKIASSTNNIESIYALLILYRRFFPATDIPESLTLKSQLIKTLSMDDVSHSNLGAVISRSIAINIP